MANETSTATRDLHKRRFKKYIRRCAPEDFLKMIWSADAVRSGAADAARPFFTFPNEAVAAPIGNPFFIHPWTLETAVNEYISSYAGPSKGPRQYDTTHWNGFCKIYESLHKWEDAEDGLQLINNNVHVQMPRLGWRQFDWQEGLVGKWRHFRYAVLFRFDEADQLFRDRYRFSMDEFALAGFAAYARAVRRPAFTLRIEQPLWMLEPEKLLRCLEVLSRSLKQHRAEAHDLRKPYARVSSHVSYQPSVLRQAPCIRIDGNYFAPLPSLIMERTTLVD